MGERESKRNIVLGVILFGAFIIIGLAFKFLVYPSMQGDLVAGTSSESQYTHELTIRLDSFSGYAALRSPEFERELKSAGIRLIIEDDAADYGARMKALQRGTADMAVFTVDAFVTTGAALGDYPATIVAVIDETNGADAIVAYRDALPELQALNSPDARLVLTPASPSEFLGRVAMAEFGLQQLSPQWDEADGAAAVLRNLRSAKRSLPRGYVLWEPYKSQALEDPDVHVLFDSSRLSGYIVDVLVVQRQFLLDHPDVARSAVQALLRTQYSYASQSGGLVRLVRDDAEAGGEPLTDAQARAVVDGIRWRNTLENYAHFGLVPRQQSQGVLHLEDSISNISGVLVRTGALAQDPVADRAHELFYQGLLQQLQASGFHPGQGLGIVDGAPVAELGQIRGGVDLPSLDDAQWQALTPVGAMQVKPIAFGRGTARLNVQSQRELDQLARRLQSLPHFYLTVLGHSRAEGDLQANKLLAQERAQAATQHLVAKGLSATRVRAVAAEPSGTGGSFQSVSFVLSQQPY